MKPEVRERLLIAGITAQAGSFRTGLPLEKGGEVHGLIRRSSMAWPASVQVAGPHPAGRAGRDRRRTASPNWKRGVHLDERYLRPTEVDVFCGDAFKTVPQVAWRATIRRENRVCLMLEYELPAAGLDERIFALQGPE